MIAWGINALNHGSSLAVFHNNRYISNRQSTQDILPESFIQHELKNTGKPDRIFWYENPWIKKARQFKAGQYSTAFDMSMLPSRSLKQWGLGGISIAYTQHHASHAAAGYYTSPFNHCAVVVLDAIGEFECATIWEGQHGELKKVWSASYPNSLGLYYSAFTKMLGMTPIQDEYLLQQMAEKGDPRKFSSSIDLYFGKNGPVNLDYNFHRGVRNWRCDTWSDQEKYDLAAAVQERFEIEIAKVMYKAKQLTGADCLVYMGGCAMNSRANKNEVEHNFKYIWSLPNPGDPSSSIGAVLYHTKQRVQNIDLGVVKHIQVRV
jgi:carbamoyltransferase